MSKGKLGSILIGSMMILGFAAASQAEDGLGWGVACGAGCGVGTQATPDSLVAAIPGGTFAITVAHLAPSPEDAFVNGAPVACKSVAIRVDALRVGARDVAVELGERVELAAGESLRIVQQVDPKSPRVGPGMDQMTFRLRADGVSQACDLVASGMFFDADGSSPKSFSLIVDDGSKR